jgi:hypothetical protein
MIDSIGLSIDLMINPEQVRQLNKTTRIVYGPGYSYKSHELRYQVEMKKKGFYAPRLELREYETKKRARYYLFITVSVPKLIYGTNYYEADNHDFNLFKKILTEHIVRSGITFSSEMLNKSKIDRIDFSKNIRLPGWTGTASQFIRSLSAFNYKQRSDFKYDIQIIGSGRIGDYIKFNNSSQDFTVYDKTSEIINHGFTKEENDLISLIKAGKVKKNLLRFELSLHNKQTMKKFLAKFIKSEITLEKVFNKKISREVITATFNNVYPAGFAILVEFSNRNGYAFENYLHRNGYKFDDVARLTFIINKVAKIGLKQTLEYLGWICKEEKLRRLKEMLLRLPEKCEKQDVGEANMFEYLRLELSKFLIIKPHNK